jgi:putative transposase
MSIRIKNNQAFIFPDKLSESLEFRGYKNIKKFIKIKKEKNIPDINESCRLSMKNNRIFYLHIPYSIKKVNKFDKDNIVSLDPGVINFQSFYSRNSCGMLGNEARQRILKLKILSSRLQSKLNRLPEKSWQYNKVKREYLRVITKPSRLVNELHKKTALFLCSNFDTILIPEFKTQDIVKKMVNYSKEVKDTILQLSHYKFKEFLKHKGEIMGKNVIIVTEEYTSQTCGKCGNLKKCVRTYKCSKCDFILDRDLNGARNIFIKNTSF